MNALLQPCVTKVLRTIVLACLAGLLPTAVFAQTIVWTDVNVRRIQAKDVNGGQVQTIVQFPSSPTATQIDYDPISYKLYYRLGTTFQRANLDGSNPENIPTPSAGNFTLNVDSRKLYWIEPFADTVHRADLDGAGVLSHTYSACCVFCLEAFGDDLFFGAGNTLEKGIWRADADGSNEQFLDSTGIGSGAPHDLAHDPVDNKLYCLAQTGLFRVNLDGSGKEDLLFLLPDFSDKLIVDPFGRKLYWTYEGQKIQRSNLDGSNVEDFVTATEIPNADLRGLTIVYSSTPVPDISGSKGRGLSFTVQPLVIGSPNPTAIQVTMIDLQNPVPPNLPANPPPDFSDYESATCTASGEANGCARWVGKPATFLESQDDPGAGSFRGARLQCTPLYHDFAAEGLIHVLGAEILPSSSYDVKVFSQDCPGDEANCSWTIRMTTRRWGDIAANFNPPSTTSQPDAIDVSQVVNKIKNISGAPSKAIAQLQPNLPELNADVNALDIVAVVNAVRQNAYPFSGPCPCPSPATCSALACTGSGECTGSTLLGLGPGATCVKTCLDGANAGDPCINHSHCPGGTCGGGFCRDRCGRCTP